MKYLSAAQIEILKNKIQEELSKRCIHAPIVRFEEIEDEGFCNQIEMETEDFTTVPMLFKRVNCICFGSGIREVEESENDKTYIRLWMCVNYSYEPFSDGRNGHEIFSLVTEFVKGSNHMNFKIN